MVSGGFKVWHIIFIIIALVITLVVVYCCFHRCRIPRTKQEIEADLMRSNMSIKFRDYLQELPNEQISFSEALKRVQELEKKHGQDPVEPTDAGMRKRKGWLKLKGKQEPEKDDLVMVNDIETVGQNRNKSASGQDKTEKSNGGFEQPLRSSIENPIEPRGNKSETKEIGSNKPSPIDKPARRKRHNKPSLTRTKPPKARPSLTLIDLPQSVLTSDASEVPKRRPR